MFEKEYFTHTYSKGSLIDGDFNSKEHAKYLSSLFELMELNLNQLVDFGFGKGNLLKDIKAKFKPNIIEACDLSHYSYKKIKNKAWAKNIDFKLCPIHEFRSRYLFDLGLCNSVLQYVPDEHLEPSVKVMAKKTRYLYLHIPTKEDYEILKSCLSFEDPYAIKRPRSFYRDLLGPYFTVVAYGLLESKLHPQKTSPFLDSFYRF